MSALSILSVTLSPLGSLEVNGSNFINITSIKINNAEKHPDLSTIIDSLNISIPSVVTNSNIDATYVVVITNSTNGTASYTFRTYAPLPPTISSITNNNNGTSTITGSNFIPMSGNGAQTFVKINNVNMTGFAYVFTTQSITFYSEISVTDIVTVQTAGGSYMYPPPSTNICFLAGTPIKTDQGSIDIEKINIDKHTINKNKIIAITKTKNEVEDSLVFFEKNSISKNYPKKDTIISRRHKILYKGIFKEAQEYINETTIYEIKYNDEVLYNVLLDTHSIMKVNNLICETLHPENKVALFYKEKIKEGLSADNIIIQFKKTI